MTYCNNCGRESHCGEPKFEMMEARKIEIVNIADVMIKNVKES